MSKIKNAGRPRGSKNKPKRAGFYKLSPDQISAHFNNAPYILVSKDWLLNKIGDTKLFDSFFKETTQKTENTGWEIQQL